jgi:tetratricopeptide (TPR) repeat protein
LLTTLHHAELSTTAARRDIEPPRLISLLKGDLDWIVMKALEKDRTRRYATTNALALDVEHYLNNELVTARPPSRIYRFQKLVQRNRALFVSSGAVALALILGLGAATWMYIREREARQEQAHLREQAEAAERRESELRQQAEAKEQINQVAIYVSQNKFEEANEILNQVKLLPKQPSFDGVVAYRRVGEWLALQQRWAEAAERYVALMEIDKLDTWQLVTLDYQACGVLLAECGNQERYEAFCRAAIARFRDSANGDMLGRILKTCLLFPPGKSLMQQLTPMAEVTDGYFNPIPPERFPPWPALYLALWEYRLGNFAAATAWCSRGIERSSRIPALKATLQVISAMASRQQGQAERARQELADARQLIDARFESGLQSSEQQGVWYDWLFARVLLKEAAVLIEGGQNSSTGASR